MQPFNFTYKISELYRGILALVGVYVDLMALGPNLHDLSSIFPCAVLKLVTSYCI